MNKHNSNCTVTGHPPCQPPK